MTLSMSLRRRAWVSTGASKARSMSVIRASLLSVFRLRAIVVLSRSSGLVSAVSRIVPPSCVQAPENAVRIRAPHAESGAITSGARRPSDHARSAICSASSSGAKLMLSILKSSSIVAGVASWGPLFSARTGMGSWLMPWSSATRSLVRGPITKSAPASSAWI